MPSAECGYVERDLKDGGSARGGADQLGTRHAWGVVSEIHLCRALKEWPWGMNLGRQTIYHDIEHAANEVSVSIAFEEGRVTVMAFCALFDVVLGEVYFSAHHMEGSVKLLCILPTVPYRVVFVSSYVIFSIYFSKLASA